jgi:hypothetical protein
MLCKQKVSHKSEMAGPVSRDGTIINKTFLHFITFKKPQIFSVHVGGNQLKQGQKSQLNYSF